MLNGASLSKSDYRRLERLADEASSTPQKMLKTVLRDGFEYTEWFVRQVNEGDADPEELERLVREALRSRRVERLGKAREKLAAEPLPPMTPEEIQAEIDAYRAQVRRAVGA